MSPFCSVDTGGDQLIDMLVVVNVTTDKFRGAPVGTNVNMLIKMRSMYKPNSKAKKQNIYKPNCLVNSIFYVN